MNFTLGVVLGVVGLPWATWRLHRSNQIITASSGRGAGRPLPASLPAVPLHLVGDAAPDLKPDVTPAQVKAGEVRRVQGPPCHDCPCCTTYATRLQRSQDEVDRLRDELLAADARRINLRPRPNVIELHR